MNKLPHMASPCKDCPFRKDTTKGWLGADRMKEICAAKSFVCHKTTNGSLDQRQQCAGHMLLLEHQNTFYTLVKQANLSTVLTGRDLIFDNVNDCINHHNDEVNHES